MFTVPNYRRWIRDIEELQTVKMNIALLADPDCAVLASVTGQPFLLLTCIHSSVARTYVSP